ncbi:MAG TPA: aminomethyl-transferring glycine dehydrogenase subunit GcvPA [Anaerovoracaceae bacterium]|nr:aminomethyl-transferring glycine dehydrogenase subunit GcvPA [Anaerovoracaceae bacterium]
MTPYISNTEEQRQGMLEDIGKASVQELFAGIPEKARLKKKLDLPPALAEMELAANMKELSGKNFNLDEYTCFLGAGAYDHYIPSVVGNLTARQEFYTAYTPYQPEISQGTLQAIFEFQTMICELTGMELSNASMYDGATALAEAAAMACQHTGRNEVLIARTIHPESRDVLRTYARFKGVQMTEIGHDNGRIDEKELQSRLNERTAAVILQSPNFFGIIEDVQEAAELAHKNKSLMIVSADPISLSILKSPGESGADIVVGEGQSLGNPLNFGGPYLGFMAATKQLMRKLPGRVVGETTDIEGKRAFVLTLQTREQHIRREKATSNICSNQALNALAASIYMTVLGKQGLKDAAMLCLQKAHYLHDRLIGSGKFESVFPAPFFKEFAVKSARRPEELNDKLLSDKIIGGYALQKDYPELENGWLLAVTEKRTRQEIDRFAERAVSYCD